MAYNKHVFRSGDTLYASQLDEMDTQIMLNEAAARQNATAIGSCVKVANQVLTQDQQAVARTNIGAASQAQVEQDDNGDYTLIL